MNVQLLQIGWIITWLLLSQLKIRVNFSSTKLWLSDCIYSCFRVSCSIHKFLSETGNILTFEMRMSGIAVFCVYILKLIRSSLGSWEGFSEKKGKCSTATFEGLHNFSLRSIQAIFDFNVRAQHNATLRLLQTNIILNWVPQFLILAQSPGVEVALNLDFICKQHFHIKTND